jgi:hypothetical protein
MRFRAALLAVLAALLVAFGSGCVLPAGRPIIVDRRAGDYWSGDGVLLEVSPDGTECKVAVRNDALFVEKRWVACKFVHEKESLRG